MDSCTCTNLKVETTGNDSQIGQHPVLAAHAYTAHGMNTEPGNQLLVDTETEPQPPLNNPID
jgi:hypothetical protein